MIEMANCCRICGCSIGNKYFVDGFNWFRCNRCTTMQKVLTSQQYTDLKPTYDPGLYFDSVRPCGRIAAS